ncbi:MAG TPA: hypothetical protein VG034_06410 [Acidimicrobiia bacterium]|jgi:SLT domain-containing protein|nr:hypothetical protein [Acidimicrobiia bacterium]
MDGIAAIEARVTEICTRFAPPAPPAIDYIRRRYGDPSSTPGLRALARGERYVGY